MKIIHLSDLHLPRHFDARHSQKINQALQIAQNISADAMVLSGDLIDGGTHQDYLRLLNLLDIGVPIYAVAGNHDVCHSDGAPYPHTKLYRHARNLYLSTRTIDYRGQRILCVNTSVYGCTHGQISKRDLTFLRTHINAHAIVVMHHPPLPIGARWLDQIGLINAHDFWRIVGDMPITILCGHVHQALVLRHKRTQVICAPSLSRPFAHSDTFCEQGWLGFHYWNFGSRFYAI